MKDFLQYNIGTLLTCFNIFVAICLAGGLLYRWQTILADSVLKS